MNIINMMNMMNEINMMNMMNMINMINMMNRMCRLQIYRKRVFDIFTYLKSLNILNCIKQQ